MSKRTSTTETTVVNGAVVLFVFATGLLAGVIGVCELYFRPLMAR